MILRQAAEELDHLLQEWSVPRERVEFRGKLHKEVERAVEIEGVDVHIRDLRSSKFPVEYEKAIEHALRSDIEEDLPSSFSWYIEVDTLFDDVTAIPSPPKFRLRPRNRIEEDQQPRYRRKKEFAKFKEIQLDPFYRLKFNRVTLAELWYHRWFVQREDARAGNIFEAVLVCHVLQSEPCYQCKFRNALRWNGGSSEAWQDMICTECGSMYEVKTKASMEKIESNFDYNKIPGGSFSKYYKLRNGLKKDQKMFLVLLPRTFTCDRFGKECYPVRIAEIKSVLPRLAPLTFNVSPSGVSGNREAFYLPSSVAVHPSKLWFNLPLTKELSHTHQETRARLFKKRFSEEEFARLEAKRMSATPVDEPSPSMPTQHRSAPSEQDNAQSVDTLKRELDKLKVGNDECDDWEEMYESEAE